MKWKNVRSSLDSGILPSAPGKYTKLITSVHTDAAMHILLSHRPLSWVYYKLMSITKQTTDNEKHKESAHLSPIRSHYGLCRYNIDAEKFSMLTRERK